MYGQILLLLACTSLSVVAQTDATTASQEAAPSVAYANFPGWKLIRHDAHPEFHRLFYNQTLCRKRRCPPENIVCVELTKRHACTAKTPTCVVVQGCPGLPAPMELVTAINSSASIQSISFPESQQEQPRDASKAQPQTEAKTKTERDHDDHHDEPQAPQIREVQTEPPKCTMHTLWQLRSLAILIAVCLVLYDTQLSLSRLFLVWAGLFLIFLWASGYHCIHPLHTTHLIDHKLCAVAEGHNNHGILSKLQSIGIGPLSPSFFEYAPDTLRITILGILCWMAPLFLCICHCWGVPSPWLLTAGVAAVIHLHFVDLKNLDPISTLLSPHVLLVVEQALVAKVEKLHWARALLLLCMDPRHAATHLGVFAFYSKSWYNVLPLLAAVPFTSMSCYTVAQLVLPWILGCLLTINVSDEELSQPLRISQTVRRRMHKFISDTFDKVTASLFTPSPSPNTSLLLPTPCSCTCPQLTGPTIVHPLSLRQHRALCGVSLSIVNLLIYAYIRNWHQRFESPWSYEERHWLEHAQLMWANFILGLVCILRIMSPLAYVGNWSRWSDSTGHAVMMLTLWTWQIRISLSVLLGSIVLACALHYTSKKEIEAEEALPEEQQTIGWIEKILPQFDIGRGIISFLVLFYMWVMPGIVLWYIMWIYLAIHFFFRISERLKFHLFFFPSFLTWLWCLSTLVVAVNLQDTWVNKKVGCRTEWTYRELSKIGNENIWGKHIYHAPKPTEMHHNHAHHDHTTEMDAKAPSVWTFTNSATLVPSHYQAVAAMLVTEPLQLFRADSVAYVSNDQKQRIIQHIAHSGVSHGRAQTEKLEEHGHVHVDGLVRGAPAVMQERAAHRYFARRGYLPDAPLAQRGGDLVEPKIKLHTLELCFRQLNKTGNNQPDECWGAAPMDLLVTRKKSAPPELRSPLAALRNHIARHKIHRQHIRFGCDSHGILDTWSWGSHDDRPHEAVFRVTVALPTNLNVDTTQGTSRATEGTHGFDSKLNSDSLDITRTTTTTHSTATEHSHESTANSHGNAAEVMTKGVEPVLVVDDMHRKLLTTESQDHNNAAELTEMAKRSGLRGDHQQLATAVRHENQQPKPQRCFHFQLVGEEVDRWGFEISPEANSLCSSVFICSSNSTAAPTDVQLTFRMKCGRQMHCKGHDCGRMACMPHIVGSGAQQLNPPTPAQQPCWKAKEASADSKHCVIHL